MKVNEIVKEGQVFQGIKQVGKGLGNVLGGAATGVVRGLDRLGGGSGQVGTRSQIAAYNAEKKRKLLSKADQRLPQEALGQFEAELAQQGIDLDDAAGINPRQMGTMLQSFATRFFAGGESRDIQNYIIKTLPYEPVPTQFNRATIENYFGEIVKIRQNARTWIDQNREEIAAQREKETQAATAEKEPATSEPAVPGLAKGVSVLSMEPMVLQVGKQRYYVADDGLWHEAGNRNPVDSTWNAFLTQQADIATPESNVRATGSGEEPARTEPSPAEIRARKQADAVARARAQLGLK